MILWQVTTPTADMNAWVWVAGAMAMALGVVALRYDQNTTKRIERSEGREDTLIADSRVVSGLLKEQSEAITKSTDTAAQAVTLALETSEQVEDLAKEIAALRNAYVRTLPEAQRGQER